MSQVITDDFRGAGFGAVPDPKVMKKYGKLLMNVGNAVQAIIDPRKTSRRYIERLERRAVYSATNINYADRKSSRIWEEMKITAVPGYERTASSSWRV